MTIADIAASAGVSSRDVVLVLAEDYRVEPGLRGHLVEELEAAGYTPLAAVRARIGRALRIAIVFRVGRGDGLDTNLFYGPIASAIGLASARAGVELVHAPMVVDNDRERGDVPSAIRDANCDAAFVLGAALSAQTVQTLDVGACPVGLVDGYSEGDALDSVVTANAAGARMAVEHLVAAGHRGIALLGTQPVCYPSVQERRSGYVQALEAGGLGTRFIDIEYVYEEAGADLALGYLKRHPDVTAVIGANDWTVLAFMRRARGAGIRIPADLSLVGFDDVDVAAMVNPALTTLAIDKALMGRAAFALMAHRLEVPTAEPVTAVVMPSLVERESVAHLRAR